MNTIMSTTYQTPALVDKIAADLLAMEKSHFAEIGHSTAWADTPSAERARLREAHRLAAEQTGSSLDDYGRFTPTVAEIVAATRRPGASLPDQLAELSLAATDRRTLAELTGSDHFGQLHRDARELDAIVLTLRARMGYVDLDEPPQ